ncbi:MAG: hypothetical protein PF542_05535 [Nanoarchaeota archaeon]|jgi:hypothetical protein|nr:hypothetical protein [Nanoarchaeota archaeon]
MIEKLKEFLKKIGRFLIKIFLYYGAFSIIAAAQRGIIVIIFWQTGNLPEPRNMFKGNIINTESVSALILSILWLMVIPVSIKIIIYLKRLSRKQNFKENFPKTSSWISKNF